MQPVGFFKNVNSEKIKYIHFTGIKGVGMTALAIFAKEMGIKVSGSDQEAVRSALKGGVLKVKRKN